MSWHARDEKQKGQVVLILVLLTVIGLTVGLSLISRTVTDVRISSQIEQSGRAFSAAEAGIETALVGSSIGGTASGNVTLDGANASYSVENQGGGTGVSLYPLTEVGNGQTIWFVNHTQDGKLDETNPVYTPDTELEICWGTSADAPPAIAVTYVYDDAGTYNIVKGMYDPIGTRGNNFSSAESAGGYCNGTFLYRVRITPSSDLAVPSTATLLFVRLTPVYFPTAIAVRPSAALPVQSRKISSVGQTETGVVRKIQVTQTYPIIPELLHFTLFVEN